MRTLDVRQVAAADRGQVLREAISSHFAPVEVDYPGGGEDIDYRGSFVDLGSLGLISQSCSAMRVRRTARQARDDTPPSLYLGLKTAGTGVVDQGGRQVAISPGDLSAYVSTEPLTLVAGVGSSQRLFRMPLEHLALRHEVLAQLTAVHLDRDPALADLVFTYLSRLVATTEVMDASAAQAVVQPSIDLVRALITSQLDDPRLAREALGDTLAVRVVEYLDAHWSEPDLSAGRMAAVHHISTRHLYNVLSEAGISLGDWVRARRLEECRKDLAGPGAQWVTVAAVGRRWGFSDATHFGRAFKDAYGLTPGDWRDLHHRS